MTQKLSIELENRIYQSLAELCKNDEKAMRDYIVQALKEKLDQKGLNDSSKDQDNLESYLNKGQPGSRNYGVKGQGW